MKQRVVVWVAVAVVLVGCGSIEINMRDGQARIEAPGCEGVKLLLIVRQDPVFVNIRQTISGNVVKFESKALDGIDFKREVTITVTPDAITGECGIPPRTLTLGPIVLTPKSNKVYEIDLSDFR